MKPSKHSGELAGAILEDSRRQAIDAAKKRAVAQQVDYDTFKKLVRTHYRIHKRKAMDGFAAEELMNALCSSSAYMLVSCQVLDGKSAQQCCRCSDLIGLHVLILIL